MMRQQQWIFIILMLTVLQFKLIQRIKGGQFLYVQIIQILYFKRINICILMQPEQNPNNQSFDQKPIGQGQKIADLSQYPPDWNPDQLNVQSKPQPLPLHKRIHSKVWKVRKEALQQLYNEVAENFTAYQEYFKDTVAFITDANQLCQERALRILIKYLEGAGRSLDDPKSIIKALIQKCLVVEKGQSSNLASEIMFWMMDNYSQILLNEVNENLLNKNPKISTSVMIFLEKLLNNYGAKKLKQLEQFGKSFTLLGNSVRPIAKQQTISLFKQVYKWMGQSTFNFNMHAEVKDQVIKFAKTYVKQPMIIKRGLNEDQKNSKKPIVQNNEEDDSQQPQDVLLPYDSRWVDKILEEPKWKQKKSMLEEFIKKTKVKNICPRESSHYITLIKRLLSDNNINLLQCGFKIVKNLSKGLKKGFTHPCKVILGLIISKFRDTKGVIVDQAQQTLESMMNCLTIDDLLEDIKDGLKDKAPNMRFQTLRYLQKMISRKDKKMLNAYKNITTIIVDLNQDGASEVRDKAMDVLCKLKGAYGINFFGDKLKKIPQKKLQAIQNYIDPNLENKIQQEPIQDKSNQVQSKFIQKKSVKTNFPANQNFTIASKSTILTQPPQKVSNFSVSNFQFDSSSENSRMNTYQNLLQKPSNVIHQQLIEGFKNRVPMYRQSNPSILKLILSCVKKCVHQNVGLEHLEVLMYHDWKKCKPLLLQFVQSNKLNLTALEFVKNNGILTATQNQNIKKPHQNQKNLEGFNNQQSNFQSNSQPLTFTSANNQPSNPLKLFYSSIQSFIPKMSNPDPVVRLQAVETALEVLEAVPIGAPIQSSIQPTPAISQSISQLFNVLKYRIQDSNQQIVNNYINLITEMLSKGFLTKYRTPGRNLISMLLQRINNPRLTHMQHFIKEMVANHSSILWQFLTVQLCRQNICGSVLNIIKNNNESFFKMADQKAYVLPLLTCISKDMEVQKCSELLDQIVQINGQQCLDRIVKDNNKLACFNIDNYLKKWNIQSISPLHQQPEKLKQHTSSNPSNIFSVSFPHSKLERISLQKQNPWPLTPSPTHILKIITQMISMGEPFQTLASPTILTQNQLNIIASLTEDLLQDYSDLWVKWIFWRVHIQQKPRNVEVVLNLILKIISLGFELHQSEIITILGTMVSCLLMHKDEKMTQLCQINSSLNHHPLYKQKSFRFWINSFNDPTAPVDQILSLIVKSCSDMIPSEMVTLARFPAVVKNKQFNQYLRANFTQKLLIVYGFKLQDISKSDHKQILSQTISLPTLTELESKYFIEIFQRTASGQLLEKLLQETQEIPSEHSIETHLKIMHSIIVPYLRRQLSFINVYNYFKYLQRLVNTCQCSGNLMEIVKVLSFFLIDLDQIKLQNCGEMLKTINKLLLILLQVSNPKQILQVLMTILKQQLRMVNNGNTKLTLLLPKCIVKIIKNNNFKIQYQRTAEHAEILSYIVKQFVQIISKYNIGIDTSLMKTIKNLVVEMIALYPNSVAIFQSILHNQNGEKLPQRAVTFINQLIKDKIKQNSFTLPVQNNNIKTQQAATTTSINPENIYVQTKDIKTAGNIMKSLKSAVGGMGIFSKEQLARKNLQKMGQ